MLLKKYNSIMQREEAHRSKWALGLSIFFSLVIFFGWAFYRGFLTVGSEPTLAGSVPTEELAASAAAPSPLQNSKQSLNGAFDRIKKQYSDFVESVSAVLVPFVTGIEVYEKK